MTIVPGAVPTQAPTIARWGRAFRFVSPLLSAIATAQSCPQSGCCIDIHPVVPLRASLMSVINAVRMVL